MKFALNTITRLACTLTLLISSVSHAQVGMRQIQSGDMPITLTYPTAALAQAVVRGPFTLHASQDAAPLPAAPGSRRLVVLSHGTAGSPEPDFQLATPWPKRALWLHNRSIAVITSVISAMPAPRAGKPARKT